MLCEFCSYEFPDDLGRYGCPNCEGEGIMSTEAKEKMFENMTRAEALRLIYRWTPSDYKGKAGEVWGPEYQGRKTVMVNRGGTCLVLLEDLTDAEIADKLPGAMRQEANRKAKAALAKAAKKQNVEA